jgi:putative ABC transport system permease protein
VVGEKVRIGGKPFRVIGVIEEKGGSQMGSEDDQVLIPLTTAQARLMSRNQRDQVDVIFVQAADSELMTKASNEISQILRTRHRTDAGEDDFSITSQQDIIASASMITNILTILLGGIAGVSLLVGGIGIMNIMLVSVIERTKEIGLRKAMGARKTDILAQFLIESSLLSLVGGLLGIGLGWAIAIIIEEIAMASGVTLIPIVSSDAILLATLFSAAVGVFFGLYPANRAASLEPVEALRSE